MMQEDHKILLERRIKRDIRNNKVEKRAIVAPGGVFKAIEAMRPNMPAETLKNTENNIDPLRDFANCKDVAAGVIKREETRITPTSCTAETTVRAISAYNK